MTLISAPAGFGKTTLAAEWAAQTQQPFAWLSLDQRDDDLATLLHYLTAAIERVAPGSAATTVAVLKHPQMPPPEHLIAAFINDMSQLADPLVLVLDDYHFLKDPHALLLLSSLVDGPPSRLHLVIVSRVDPLLPVARLRANRQVEEIRAHDLRFSAEETATLFERRSVAPYNRQLAAELHQQTEGWIAGLQLATIITRGNQIDPQALNHLAQRTQTYIFDYFVSEVLMQQTSNMRAFLLETSILDRLNADLVASVSRQSGDGAANITTLVKDNLFVVRLDEEGEWYRYHHLFQKVLQKQLLTDFGREHAHTLHHRASDWFANNGYVDRAIRHALLADDDEAAAGLIESNSQNLLNNLERRTHQRWLAQMPGEVISQRPRLLLARAWLLFREWRLSALESTLDKLETMLAEKGQSGLDEALGGQIATLRAAGALFFRHNPTDTLQHAEAALQQLSPDAHDAQALALVALSGAHQSLGSLATAVSLLEPVIDSPGQSGPSRTQAHIGLVLIHLTAADLEKAWQTAQRFEVFPRDSGSYNATPASAVFTGRLRYERNQLEDATTAFQLVLDHRYDTNFIASFEASMGLARIALTQGKIADAQTLINSLRNEVVRLQSSDLIGVVNAFQARVWLAAGETADALRWARSANPATLYDTVLLTEVSYLTQARVLIAAGSIAEITAVAETLVASLGRAEQQHDVLNTIRIQLHLALAHTALGQRDAALQAAESALVLAYPGGLVRTFVDVGPELVTILKRCRPGNAYNKYRDDLLAAFQPEIAKLPPPSFETATLLTTREREVLRLMDEGLSNKEIADRLIISLHTVKRHVYNIFGKLDVGNRREAIYKAQDLRLLS